MPTTKQDDDFADEMKDDVSVKRSALDSAIEWIRKNLDPDECI